MSRVFVVQDPMFKTSSGRVRRKMDLSPAAEYGELVFILDWSDNPRINAQGHILPRVRESLADYGDDDYILLVGSFSAMVMAGLVAADINEGRVRLLEWDRDEHKYDVIELDMESQAAQLPVPSGSCPHGYTDWDDCAVCVPH